MVNRLKAQLPTSARQRRSVSDSSAQAQAPLSTLEKALGQVLEVLLNKPSCIHKVTAVLGPDHFSDSPLGAAAKIIFKWAADSDQPQLAQLLGDCTELEQADLITSLAQEGAQKDNLQDNLSGALDYINTHRQNRELQQTAESLRNAQDDLSEQQIKGMLEQVQSQLRQQNQRNPGVHA